eukprot:682553-Prymnesium_polylepis.1
MRQQSPLRERVARGRTQVERREERAPTRIRPHRPHAASAAPRVRRRRRATTRAGVRGRRRRPALLVVAVGLGGGSERGGRGAHARGALDAAHRVGDDVEAQRLRNVVFLLVVRLAEHRRVTIACRAAHAAAHALREAPPQRAQPVIERVPVGDRAGEDIHGALQAEHA